MKKYKLTISAMCWCYLAMAQTTISGEIRPRSELRNGYQSLFNDEDKPSFFISQRTRLNFAYKQYISEACISVQDVRIWGDEKFNTYNPSLALNEAWLKLSFNSNLSLKVGRQAIDFENKRILSSANWNQTSKKHDAVYVNYQRKGWIIDFVNAFNQSSEGISGTDYSNGSGNYKYLNTLWLTKKGKSLAITGMELIDCFEPVRNNLFTRFTFGTIITYSKNQMSFTGRAFGQTGKKSIDQQVASLMLNFEGFYQLNRNKITAGTEVLPGNDLKNEDIKSHTFEMPYGAKHAFNGTMDYFKSSSDTRYLGLTDRYLKWTHKLNEKAILQADYHWFSTTTSYFADDMFYSKYLASEFDFLFKININKDLNVEFGYSLFKESSLLKIFKGGSTGKLNQWAYAMLTFKPVFL